MDAELLLKAKTRKIQESKVGDDAGIINRKNEVGMVVILSMGDLYAGHTMGGMMEFEKTGIYPNKLRISSTRYRPCMAIKTEESQSGMLKNETNSCLFLCL
jgi:hypothetical protein